MCLPKIIWQDWRFLLVSIESEVEKILSANDLGETNSHQAGLLVPHKIVRTGIFPSLSDSKQNPRLTLTFVELEGNLHYEVNYIKYNNKVFGGTRYEYRITGVSQLLRHNLLRPGDSIIFRPMHKLTFRVGFVHRGRNIASSANESWIIKGVLDGTK